MKPQVKEIPVSIFKRGVIIFLGTPEELLKYLEDKYPIYANQLKEDWDRFLAALETSSALTIKTTADPIIYAQRPLPIHELIHELAHATFHILSLVRVKDEETECYTIEYLFEQTYDWMNSLYKKYSRGKS